MTDIAIVIGHHPDAPGATIRCGPHQWHEYDFWKPWANVLFGVLTGEGFDVSVIERPNPDPDHALAERINATGARCAIELHFNGFRDRAVHGTEMLYWNESWSGRNLADLLQDRVTDCLGTRNRGAKPIHDGYPFLRLSTMPAVICEPGYGTNPQDANRLVRKQDLLLDAYRSAIVDFLT